MNDYQVPTGWVARRYCDESDFIVLIHPEQIDKVVTIDFCRRWFDRGIGLPSRHVGSSVSYGGRGWRQAMVDDAVAWLSRQTA